MKRTRHSARWLAPVVAGVALACASACTEPEPPPDPPGDAELQAGVGALDGTGFFVTQTGQDAELVPGAQGGFHIWINFRVHKAAGKLYVKREARLSVDDSLILRGQRTLVEVPEDAMQDWWESPSAAPAFMCPSPLGLKVFDTEVAFQVLLENEDGELIAEDEIILTPRCPEGDQNEFCREICSG